MKLKSTFFLCLVILGLNTTISAQVNVQDSLALIDLYNSTDGPNWYNTTNWISGPVKAWYGITVVGNRVTEIFLSYNNLKGKIPSSLENLSELNYLNLSANNLNGVIPKKLGNLSNLEYLSLWGNQLKENIPPQIGNLRKLKYLFLDNNQLTGSIPSELGNLHKLKEIYLRDNELSGNIPHELGNLINLSSLDLQSNNLKGRIPSEFSNLTKLTFLGLQHNHLSGQIPGGLGNLSMLYSLFLNHNRLTGFIPPQLGKLINLDQLDLSHNQLTGNIPAQLGNISTLISLDLSNNKLTGSIPPRLGKLANLEYLYLNNNQLSGPIPDRLNDLLFFLLTFLSNNRFTFEGLEKFVKTHYSTAYSPQANIPVNFLNDSTLYVSAGGTLKKNTYRWHMIGSSDVVIIKGDSVFRPANNGRYYATINNAVCTNLTLSTDTIDFKKGLFATSNNNNLPAWLSPGGTKEMTFIYPVPAKDILHIQSNSKAPFLMIDQSGNVLRTININNTRDVDISNFPSGFYYLKNTESGKIRKFLIYK